MKELLTISANFSAVWTEEKKLLPQVEIVLVLSEPTYTVDAAGEVVSHRETSATRFAASPRMLRKMSDTLEKLAAEAETLLTPTNESQ